MKQYLDLLQHLLDENTSAASRPVSSWGFQMGPSHLAEMLYLAFKQENAFNRQINPKKEDNQGRTIRLVVVVNRNFSRGIITLPEVYHQEYVKELIDSEMSGCENWSPETRRKMYEELKYITSLPGCTEPCKKKLRALLQDPMPDYAYELLASPDIINSSPTSPHDELTSTISFKLVKSRLDQFLEVVVPYGFWECEKLKGMNDDEKQSLLALLIDREVHYAMAMLVGVLGFHKVTKGRLIEDDNGRPVTWTQKWFANLIKKAFPHFNIRAIEGNFRKLDSPKSYEDESRYCAKKYVKQAEEDLAKIVNKAA